MSYVQQSGYSQQPVEWWKATSLQSALVFLMCPPRQRVEARGTGRGGAKCVAPDVYRAWPPLFPVDR